MSWILPKPLVSVLTGLVLFVTPLVAKAQATSRTCIGQAGEVPGPACLVAHQDIGTLPGTPLYWSIFTFSDVEAAERVRPSHGVVVQAFSQVWMFDLGAEGRQFEGGKHVADVGPLPLETTQGEFTAEYLKSTFAPGMTAPVHVHSGPEAFYAISGATCLETPEGVQVARGAGHSLMVRQGPPMLLMSIGGETRQGFALIVHGEGTPPTTLTSAWTPQGICPAE
jgi:quercetin dioxygenase-like cupin family protein